MSVIWLAPGVLVLLSGCAGVAAVGGAGALGTAITIATTAPVVLSDVAKAGCAVQAAANDAEGIAAASGSASWAAAFSKVSTDAGYACAW